MKLDAYKKMERPEFVEKAKQSHDLIFNELGLNDFLEICLLKKFYNDEIDSLYIKKDEDKALLLKKMAEAQFTPSLGQFQRVFSLLKDDVIAKYIKTWPTLPYTNEMLFELVNGKKPAAARSMIDACQKLKTDDALLNLADIEEMGSLIIDRLKQDNSEAFAEALAAKYFEKSSSYYSGEQPKNSNLPAEITELVVNLTNEKVLFASYATKLKNINYVELIIKKFQFTTKLSYYVEQCLEYNATIEVVPLRDIYESQIHHYILQSSIPATSKLKFIIDGNVVCDARFLEELKNSFRIANSNYNNLLVEKFLRSADLDSVKAVENDLVRHTNNRSKSKYFIRDLQANRSNGNAIASYLRPKLDSKFKAAISKNFTVEVSSKEAKASTGKRKSYYPEIMLALTSGDAAQIRKIAELGYNLTKFAEDSFQKSKNTDLSLGWSVTFKVINKMTKDEVKELLSANHYIVNKAIRSFDKTCKIVFTGSDIKEFPSLLDIDDEIKMKLFDGEALSAAIKKNYYYFSSEHFGDLSKKHQNEVVEAILKEKTLSELDYVFNDKNIEVKKRLENSFLRKIAYAHISGYSGKETILWEDNKGNYLIDDKDVFKACARLNGMTSITENLKKRSKKMYEQFARAYAAGSKELKALLGSNDARRESDWVAKFMDEFETGGAEKLARRKLLDRIRSGRSIHESEMTEAFFKVINGNDLKTEVTVCVDSAGALKKLGKNAEKEINVICNLLSSWRSEDGRKSIDAKTFKNLSVQGRIQFIYFKTEDIQAIRENNPDVKVILNNNEDIAEIMNTGSLLGLDEEVIRILNEGNHNSVVKKLKMPGLKVLRTLVNFLTFNSNQDEVEFYQELLKQFSKNKDEVTKLFDIAATTEKTNKKYAKMPKSMKNEDEYCDLYDCVWVLERHGANFGSLKIEGLKNDAKVEVIKMVEAVDPRFIGLSLRTKNLRDFDYIYEYEKMTDICTKDVMDLSRIVNLPNGFDKNPKLKAGMANALVLIGYPVLKKVRAITEFLKGEKLDLSDAFDYADQSSIVESASFKKISTESINTLLQADSSSMSILFKTVDKPTILRFLRSCSEKDNSFLEDTIKLAKNVKAGADKITEGAGADSTDAEKQEMLDLKHAILQRLDEVSSMDTIEHMHDRLVNLSSFLKSDGNVPTGQNKYVNISNSKDFKNKFGYTLFFPRNRGDINALGNMHGWCVSHQDSYFNGVVERNNVLVAICKGDSPNVSNAIALAHFIRTKDGEFKMDQIRHSKHVGNTFHDASGDFKWPEILAAVRKVDEKLAEEAAKKAA